MKHLDNNESQIINKSNKAKRQKKKLVDIIFGILSVKDKDRSTELSTLMQPLEPQQISVSPIFEKINDTKCSLSEILH